MDARASALLIAEFARRHTQRGATWGRIIGLTSGGPAGFPNEVSYGAAKAALENYTMSAAFELAPFGITANVVHALGDGGGAESLNAGIAETEALRRRSSGIRFTASRVDVRVERNAVVTNATRNSRRS